MSTQNSKYTRNIREREAVGCITNEESVHNIKSTRSLARKERTNVTINSEYKAPIAFNYSQHHRRFKYLYINDYPPGIFKFGGNGMEMKKQQRPAASNKQKGLHISETFLSTTSRASNKVPTPYPRISTQSC